MFNTTDMNITCLDTFRGHLVTPTTRADRSLRAFEWRGTISNGNLLTRSPERTQIWFLILLKRTKKQLHSGVMSEAVERLLEKLLFSR